MPRTITADPATTIAQGDGRLRGALASDNGIVGAYPGARGPSRARDACHVQVLHGLHVQLRPLSDAGCSITTRRPFTEAEPRRPIR